MRLFKKNIFELDVTKLHINATLSGENTVEKKFNAQSFDDVKDTYNKIKQEISNLESTGKKLSSINITMKGKLNGDDIDEVFNDFHKFRSFLQNSYVLQPADIGAPRPGMHT